MNPGSGLSQCEAEKCAAGRTSPEQSGEPPPETFAEQSKEAAAELSQSKVEKCAARRLSRNKVRKCARPALFQSKAKKRRRAEKTAAGQKTENFFSFFRGSYAHVSAEGPLLFSQKKPLTFPPGGVMNVLAGRETAQKAQTGSGGKSRRRAKGAFFHENPNLRHRD